MSAFDSTPPQVPYPPVDIPTPDVPAANFKDIGSSLAAGAQAVGGLGTNPKAWVDWIATIVGKIIAAILALFESVVAWLIAFILRALGGGGPGAQQIAAVVLGQMFGISLSGGDVGGSSGALAQKVVAAMGIDLGAGGGTSLVGTGPDAGMASVTQNISKFLDAVLNMEVQGWVLGATAEITSLGALRTLGELKDGVQRVMGLGRIAHMMLSPAIRATVHDPFTRSLNAALQSALLSPELLVREYITGRLDQGGFAKYMSYHGYSADQLTAWVELARPKLNAGQLQTLVEVGNISNAQAIAALKDQGYDDGTAASALFAIQATASDALLKQHLSILVEGFAERKIDDSTFTTLAGQLGLPDFILAAYQGIAADKRALNVRRPSLSEGATLVKKGVWGVDQYAALASYYGYSLSDAIDLQLLLDVELAEESAAAKAKADKAAAAAAAAAAKAGGTAAAGSAAAAVAETKGVSQAAYEALVLEGLKTIGDYQAYLTAKGIAADNVTALVEALQLKLEKQNQGTFTTAALPSGPSPRALGLADLERAVSAGDMSVADFVSRLEGLGYNTADAQLLGELAQQKIDAAAAKATAAAAAAAAVQAKHPSIQQVALGVRLGVATMADYTAALRAAGYDDLAVSLLTQELAAQLAAAKAGSAAKAAANTTTAPHGPSLAQTERLVRAGLASMDDYKAALAAAGYDAAAQTALVGLLQLQLDTDAAAAAAAGRAAAGQAGRGLSLADTARLVRYAVLPIAAYTQQLQASGLSASDAQLLTLGLTAQLQSATKTKTAMPTIAQLLAARGLTLASLESSVRSGSLTPAQFEAQLTGAGVSAADAQNLADLLAAEIANQQAAAALSADAATKAAARGLSLSQEEAAVKAGVKSLDDYAAFLGALGYNSDDVNTLVTTLALSAAYQKLIASA